MGAPGSPAIDPGLKLEPVWRLEAIEDGASSSASRRPNSEPTIQPHYSTGRHMPSTVVAGGGGKLRII